jgi:hypothetical protein
MTEVNINGTVNVKQSRGAGTALMIIFLWPVLLMWWQFLLAVWLVWIIIDGVIAIFNAEFFIKTWYQPWPIWMFGIR